MSENACSEQEIMGLCIYEKEYSCMNFDEIEKLKSAVWLYNSNENEVPEIIKTVEAIDKAIRFITMQAAQIGEKEDINKIVGEIYSKDIAMWNRGGISSPEELRAFVHNFRFVTLCFQLVCLRKQAKNCNDDVQDLCRLVITLVESNDGFFEKNPRQLFILIQDLDECRSLDCIKFQIVANLATIWGEIFRADTESEKCLRENIRGHKIADALQAKNNQQNELRQQHFKSLEQILSVELPKKINSSGEIAEKYFKSNATELAQLGWKDDVAFLRAFQNRNVDKNKARKERRWSNFTSTNESLILLGNLLEKESRSQRQ